jgi:hypothetical protein
VTNSACIDRRLSVIVVRLPWAPGSHLGTSYQAFRSSLDPQALPVNIILGMPVAKRRPDHTKYSISAHRLFFLDYAPPDPIPVQSTWSSAAALSRPPEELVSKHLQSQSAAGSECGYSPAALSGRILFILRAGKNILAQFDGLQIPIKLNIPIFHQIFPNLLF